MLNLPNSIKRRITKLKKSFDKCKVKAKISDKIRKEPFIVPPKPPNVNLTFNRDPNTYWTLVNIISDGGFGRRNYKIYFILLFFFVYHLN
jgi:hypothetical protein